MPHRAARGGVARVLVGLLRGAGRPARPCRRRPGHRGLLQLPPGHGGEGGARLLGRRGARDAVPCARHCGGGVARRALPGRGPVRPARLHCPCSGGRWPGATGPDGSWPAPTGHCGPALRPRSGPGASARSGRPARPCASTAATGTSPRSWRTASAAWRRMCWRPGPRRSQSSCCGTTGAGARRSGEPPRPQ